ncbi:MAG: hypothetical protein ACRYFU_14090 [Janthinobacterium lividum]
MRRGQNVEPSAVPEGFEGARSQVVNRTQRVVREQALLLREQRDQRRSLWAPVLISSALLLVICYAVWALLAGYDLTPTSVPDASDQLMLLLLWSLPATTVVLGLIWFRRTRGGSHNGEQMP